MFTSFGAQFDGLVLQEKLSFSPFSLESKFIHKMGQIWILMIISILFMIGHCKHVYLIWCIVWCLGFAINAFFFHHIPLNQSSLLKLYNMDSHNNLYSLVIGHSKHIFPIGIHGFDALVSQEKLPFPPFFLESKFIHQIWQTWILKIISIFFVIGHYNHVLHIRIHDLDALDLQEKLFLPPFFL